MLGAGLLPKHLPAQLACARAYLQAQQPGKTIDRCKALIPLHPLNPWIYVLLSQAYQAEGQWDKAIEASIRAIQLEPQSAWLHHNLGKILGLQNRWEEAIESFQQARQFNPKIGWFHFNLGEALVKAGHTQQAIPILKRAQKKLPFFAWTAYFLGEALLAEGQIDDAIACYQNTLRFHPWMRYLRSCLDYAKHIKRQDQSLQTFIAANSRFEQANVTANVVPQPRLRQRLLMITPYPTYPPTMGAFARMFHEMKGLAQHYEVTLVCFIFQKGDFTIETKLRDYCHQVFTVVLGDTPPIELDQPALIHRYSSRRMRQVLTQLQAIPYDIVLTDFIQMAQYAELFPNALRILAEHNIESELLRRSAQIHSAEELQKLSSQHSALQSFTPSLEEADRLARYETAIWRTYPLRFVVSELDRQHLDQRCPEGKTIVVNNGIDTQTVQVMPDNPNRIILFIGTLSYYPNLDGARYFVSEILPLIWERDPNVQFWMAGAEPPQVLWDLTADPRIRVIANPENMDDVARQCCMTVVPLRTGSGTRIKILHALALGLPIVTTSLGCEGIDVTDGQQLLIRDRPADFATATLELLNNAELRQTFRQSGRSLVEQHYDWTQIFEAAVIQIQQAYTVHAFCTGNPSG